MKNYTLATLVNDIVMPLQLPLSTLEVAEARAAHLRSLSPKRVLVINVTSE